MKRLFRKITCGPASVEDEYAAYAPLAEKVLLKYPSLEDEVKFMSLRALQQLIDGREPGDWLFAEQQSKYAEWRGL